MEGNDGYLSSVVADTGGYCSGTGKSIGDPPKNKKKKLIKTYGKRQFPVGTNL